MQKSARIAEISTKVGRGPYLHIVCILIG